MLGLLCVREVAALISFSEYLIPFCRITGKDERAENLTWGIADMLFLSSILCHELWEGCDPFSGEVG